MSLGKISKLVATHGSTWGRIRPANEIRDVFFNIEVLVDQAEYVRMKVGEWVEFDEEPDRVNGTHALRVRLSTVGITEV